MALPSEGGESAAGDMDRVLILDDDWEDEVKTISYGDEEEPVMEPSGEDEHQIFVLYFSLL